MNEIDTIDTENLTRSQAASLFESRRAEYQRNSGADFTTSWAVTRDANPKLFSRMGVHDEAPVGADIQPAGHYADSSGIIKGSAPPLQYAADRPGQAPSLATKLMPRRAISVPNDASLEFLGLPRDASYEEFACADRANAGAQPRDSKAVFAALVLLLVQSGMSPEAAQDAARVRYPELAREFNHESGAGANGLASEASVKAHTASERAEEKQGHLAAAAAHKTAASANDKAGDTETAEMHRMMVKYHTGQAKRFK